MMIVYVRHDRSEAANKGSKEGNSTNIGVQILFIQGSGYQYLLFSREGGFWLRKYYEDPRRKSEQKPDMLVR